MSSTERTPKVPYYRLFRREFALLTLTPQGSDSQPVGQEPLEFTYEMFTLQLITVAKLQL